jgi:hypothetical protein
MAKTLFDDIEEGHGAVLNVIVHLCVPSISLSKPYG